MKAKKAIIISSTIVLIFVVLLGIYLYINWENEVNEDNIDDIATDYMEEVYSYDYEIAGQYLNDFIEENYNDQLDHEFLPKERTTCIFGVDEEGNHILLIKTWRVFSRNFVIELDDYFNYDDSITYIQSVYNDIEEEDITMMIMLDDDSFDNYKRYYVGFLVNHGDHYSRFIFYEDQVVELEGNLRF